MSNSETNAPDSILTGALRFYQKAICN